MKILHINNVANVSATMVEALQALGQSAELRRMRLVAGSRSTAAKLLASPLRLQELASINRQVKTGRYDIIHIHFAYLGWLGIAGRYPYLLHCHGSDVRRDLQDSLRRWPILQSLKHARVVYYVTPDLQAVVTPFRADARFMPDPIHTDHFRPQDVAHAGPPRVLIISRLDPVKRVDIAFEAVRHLQARRLVAQVTAFNFGPQRAEFLGRPGIEYISGVSYEQMPDLIRQHDIIVGQFGLGSMGMTELESLACGRPVVCNFQYPGFYPQPPPIFCATDPVQAAEHLAALLENPALRLSAGQQGRAWVEQYHGYLSIGRQLLETYQAMLARPAA